MDDFEDSDYADEPIFRDEINAFERAGPGGKLSELLSSTRSIENIGKKGREAIPPEDRFLINTDAICRRLNSENIAKITEADINNILESTVKVVGLRYKNFIAYILGYLATQGGRSLKVENVQYIIKNVLPHVAEEGGVTPTDVVRYARYWREFL